MNLMLLLLLLQLVVVVVVMEILGSRAELVQQGGKFLLATVAEKAKTVLDSTYLQSPLVEIPMDLLIGSHVGRDLDSS